MSEPFLPKDCNTEGMPKLEEMADMLCCDFQRGPEPFVFPPAPPISPPPTELPCITEADLDIPIDLVCECDSVTVTEVDPENPPQASDSISFEITAHYTDCEGGEAPSVGPTTIVRTVSQRECFQYCEIPPPTVELAPTGRVDENKGLEYQLVVDEDPSCGNYSAYFVPVGEDGPTDLIWLSDPCAYSVLPVRVEWKVDAPGCEMVVTVKPPTKKPPNIDCDGLLLCGSGYTVNPEQVSVSVEAGDSPFYVWDTFVTRDAEDCPPLPCFELIDFADDVEPVYECEELTDNLEIPVHPETEAKPPDIYCDGVVYTGQYYTVEPESQLVPVGSGSQTVFFNVTAHYLDGDDNAMEIGPRTVRKTVRTDQFLDICDPQAPNLDYEGEELEPNIHIFTTEDPSVGSYIVEPYYEYLSNICVPLDTQVSIKWVSDGEGADQKLLYEWKDVPISLAWENECECEWDEESEGEEIEGTELLRYTRHLTCVAERSGTEVFTIEKEVKPGEIAQAIITISAVNGSPICPQQHYVTVGGACEPVMTCEELLRQLNLIVDPDYNSVIPDPDDPEVALIKIAVSVHTSPPTMDCPACEDGPDCGWLQKGLYYDVELDGGVAVPSKELAPNETYVPLHLSKRQLSGSCGVKATLSLKDQDDERVCEVPELPVSFDPVAAIPLGGLDQMSVMVGPVEENTVIGDVVLIEVRAFKNPQLAGEFRAYFTTDFDVDRGLPTAEGSAEAVRPWKEAQQIYGVADQPDNSRSKFIRFGVPLSDVEHTTTFEVQVDWYTGNDEECDYTDPDDPGGGEGGGDDDEPEQPKKRKSGSTNKRHHGSTGDCECDGSGEGGATVSGCTCEVIEPVRSPRFCDIEITPNPMAVTPDGFFFSRDLAAEVDSYNAFMSMGLGKIAGKEYKPLPATYKGGEPITWQEWVREHPDLVWPPDEIIRPDEWAEDYPTVPYPVPAPTRRAVYGDACLPVRQVGEQMYSVGSDGELLPLYLKRRDLSVLVSMCTERRGKDTSYPFRWKYIDGSYFTSGTNEIGENTYPEFLYFSGNVASNDDIASNELVLTDYYEMKPYYGWRCDEEPEIKEGEEGEGESTEEGECSGTPAGQLPGALYPPPVRGRPLRASVPLQELTGPFVGISPRHWQLTTDESEAQLDYDFLYCPNLAPDEVLIPGLKLQAVARTVKFLLPNINVYGESVLEYEKDSSGEFKLDDDGNLIPVRDANGNLKRATMERLFTYYEIIPPDSYLTTIEGQSDVTVYVGLEEKITLLDSAGGETVGEITTSRLRRLTSYVKPEEVVQPEYELVYATLPERGSASVTNPLAVIQDLTTDRFGNTTLRLKGLWYARDKEDRRYPMLFGIVSVPYGYCVEAGIVQHFAQIDGDSCAPYYLQEEYQLLRDNSCPCKTLQLLPQKCLKHRLQIPVLQ